MLPLARIVEEAVTGMGYELVELVVAPSGLLRVFLDAPAGVRIEDCERVSRQLGHVLEVEAVDYQRLEVSSPGLDRPLTKPEHFRRFLGRRVRVRTTEPIEGQRNFTGTLTAADEHSVCVDFVDIPLDRVQRSNLVPEPAEVRS